MRKGWQRLWLPHKSGWDPGQKKEKKRGKKRRREGPKNKKNERKREKGQCYYPFTTLLLQSSTMIFMIENLLCCHVRILVGIFLIRTWLAYSNIQLPPNALGLHEQACWMHTHLFYFVELSYTYSSSASVAWQSLLTHIDIYWWASPLPVDRPSWCETIFSFFVFSTTTILFHI